MKQALDALPYFLKHNFVFTYYGRPIKHKDSLKKSFQKACKNAGIPYGRKVPNGITFHDIRRSVKTNMLSAGVDKAFRDMILGHSQEGMDAHYLVSTDESLHKAMDKYTRWLDRQLEKASSLSTSIDETQ